MLAFFVLKPIIYDSSQNQKRLGFKRKSATKMALKI
jgi:hypothetical protein